MSDYRKLTCEIVEVGDYVTINDTEESGFRLFNGPTGEPGSYFSYPIYRNDHEYKEKHISRLIDLGVDGVERVEGGITLDIFVDNLYIKRITDLLTEQSHVCSK